MTVTSHDPAELEAAAARAATAASELSALAGTVPTPDTSMYGLLISQAAGHAEPAASDANRRLVAALGASTDAIADGLSASAAIYRQVEQDGVGLSNDVQTHLDGGPR